MSGNGMEEARRKFYEAVELYKTDRGKAPRVFIKIPASNCDEEMEIEVPLDDKHVIDMPEPIFSGDLNLEQSLGALRAAWKGYFSEKSMGIKCIEFDNYVRDELAPNLEQIERNLTESYGNVDIFLHFRKEMGRSRQDRFIFSYQLCYAYLVRAELYFKDGLQEKSWACLSQAKYWHGAFEFSFEIKDNYKLSLQRSMAGKKGTDLQKQRKLEKLLVIHKFVEAILGDFPEENRPGTIAGEIIKRYHDDDGFKKFYRYPYADDAYDTLRKYIQDHKVELGLPSN